MTDEEKELNKFVNDPKYREKVIKKIHKDKDTQYNKRIKEIKSRKKQREKERENLIAHITKNRWKKIANGKILVNRTEGKIRIKQSEYYFSSIKGVQLNMTDGCSVVTTENSQSKKHGSLGGAVVGGIVGGATGAVIGGVGLGKTKTTGSSVSDQIPICTHLGVLINLDGKITEIVFISEKVNQADVAYHQAYLEATSLVADLKRLAATPVPLSFHKPEEEPDVKRAEQIILETQRELQMAIAHKPVYNIPSIYRTVEQREMSDEEYLDYLLKKDKLREEEEETKKRETEEKRRTEKAQKEKERQERTRKREEDKKQREAERKERIEQNAIEKEKERQEWARQREEDKKRREVEKKEKIERNAVEKEKRVYDKVIKRQEQIKTGKTLSNRIFKNIMWICSILYLLMGIVCITSITEVLSGTIFALVAFLINPFVQKRIIEKIFHFPKWLAVIIAIVGFIIACIVAKPNSDVSKEIETPFIQADNAIQEGDYKKARAIMEKNREKADTFAGVSVYYDLYKAEKKYDKAADVLITYITNEWGTENMSEKSPLYTSLEEVGEMQLSSEMRKKYEICYQESKKSAEAISKIFDLVNKGKYDDAIILCNIEKEKGCSDAVLFETYKTCYLKTEKYEEYAEYLITLAKKINEEGEEIDIHLPRKSRIEDGLKEVYSLVSQKTQETIDELEVV